MNSKNSAVLENIHLVENPGANRSGEDIAFHKSPDEICMI